MHLHARQAILTLESGVHCASAVPMGLTLDELCRVVAAERQSGRNYMMMESALYTRAFLHARRLADAGVFGRIQFLRAAHYSDYEFWPSWKWYPPMLYATHATAPILALSGTRALRVRCVGSGSMPPDLRGPMDNPFPIQTAIFDLADHHASAEVTRSIFRMARPMQESFCVYGDDASFEWQQLENEDPLEFHVDQLPRSDHSNSAISIEHTAALANRLGIAVEAATRLAVPNRFRPIRAVRTTLADADGDVPGPIRDLRGPSEAEPRLVHEFVRSIIEQRPASVFAARAADYTAAGICAHESSLSDGTPISIPEFAPG